MFGDVSGRNPVWPSHSHPPLVLLRLDRGEVKCYRQVRRMDGPDPGTTIPSVTDMTTVTAYPLFVCSLHSTLLFSTVLLVFLPVPLFNLYPLLPYWETYLTHRLPERPVHRKPISGCSTSRYFGRSVSFPLSVDHTSGTDRPRVVWGPSRPSSGPSGLDLPVTLPHVRYKSTSVYGPSTQTPGTIPQLKFPIPLLWPHESSLT